MIKDLATLKNRKKEDIIIIDNLVNSFSNDLENGIPIKPFIRGEEDYELERIADVLEEVDEDTNCIEFVCERLKLGKFYELLG